MKVVINARHGSFGMSRVAFLWLKERGHKGALAETDVGEMFKDGSGPRLPSSLLDNMFLNRDEDRADPLLVQVVEEMGDKANGRFAKLKVIEIPDGVDYVVEEYDGFEHISEKHRTWGAS